MNSDQIHAHVAALLSPQAVPPTESQFATLYSCIDLTSLETTDHEASILQLCNRAKQTYQDKTVAGVCVYPRFVKQVKQQLANTGVRVVSVAAGFPHSQLPIHLKCKEITYCIQEGASEIDVVFPVGLLLAGNTQDAYREIALMKEACQSKPLKIILETGLLADLSLVKKAAEISIAAGADFIKTSTGKVTNGASPEAVYVMAMAIHMHYQKTGRKIGLKPSGGITQIAQALQYLQVVDHCLGDAWLNPTLFRIGASRLANALLQLQQDETSTGEGDY